VLGVGWGAGASAAWNPRFDKQITAALWQPGVEHELQLAEQPAALAAFRRGAALGAWN